LWHALGAAQVGSAVKNEAVSVPMDMGDSGAKITIRLDGPMKRSTFPVEALDPVDQAINDLLHWSWSTRHGRQRPGGLTVGRPQYRRG
jgi:hypothetical protein